MRCRRSIHMHFTSCVYRSAGRHADVRQTHIVQRRPSERPFLFGLLALQLWFNRCFRVAMWAQSQWHGRDRRNGPVDWDENSSEEYSFPFVPPSASCEMHRTATECRCQHSGVTYHKTDSGTASNWIMHRNAAAVDSSSTFHMRNVHSQQCDAHNVSHVHTLFAHKSFYHNFRSLTSASGDTHLWG